MSGGLGLRNPWRPLTCDAVADLPATLGVFELADAQGCTVLIGYAGGRSLFGLRSTLAELLAESSDRDLRFRVEQNMQYMSRWKELLMAHKAQHGTLPRKNAAQDAARLGHLGQLAPGEHA